MKHAFLDRYSDLDSPVHRISAGIKLSVSLFIISLLTIIPVDKLLIPVFIVTIFLLFVISISKIPVFFLLKRLLILLPLLLPVFILNFFFSSRQFSHSLIITSRSFQSLLTIILMISSTRFKDILRTLSTWHFPKIIVQTLSFMYRFFFLLTDESEKMVRSVALRTGGRSKFGLLKTYSHILGTLLIKSYERSDRVYKAMVMRGYDGKGDIS